MHVRVCEPGLLTNNQTQINVVNPPIKEYRFAVDAGRIFNMTPLEWLLGSWFLLLLRPGNGITFTGGNGR